MKKFIAAFVGIAFLFSTVSAPLVEANFWKERRDAARTKNSTGQGVQYAMAPGAQGALADALPLVGSFDSAAAGSTGGGQAHLLAARSVLSTEQIKLMPAWLNTISSAHGSISAAYFAPNAADRPLVVHIQDVHEQREAQMNISGLISELVNTGAVSLVGLEGATGAFDLVPYRTFPNKAVIGDVADFFLQEHLIGGGEHAGWTMEKEPTLWGIEEVNVYLKNLNSFKDSLPIQQRVQDRIKSWEYRLAQAKPTVYSPALKSFDEAQARYRTDSMPLPDFVALMEKSVKIEEKKYPAMAAFKKCLAMEKGLDFADVERERARLIESLTKALSEKEISALVQRTLLYKSGHLTYGGYYDSLQTICETRGVSLSRFPAMASYIKYVLASEQIKPEALLEELDMVQDQAASTLVRSADERAVYELAQDLHSLANLTAFKMAPRDWEIYQRTRDRIMNIAARMDQVAPGADNFKGDLPKDLVSFEGFCQAALKRDETLVNNLLAKMKETNQKTGLLLAGGFHTQGMTDLLKKGKVSYVVFTPTLTDVSSDSHYLDFLKDRPALEKLFTQEKITTKAPIIASADSPTPGFEQAKVSLNALAETVVTAVSGGQVTPEVSALSPNEIKDSGEEIYSATTGDKEVSVAVGEGSENKGGLGKLVAAFSGKVSSFAIFVKDSGIASYLSPTVLIAKVVGLFSGQNRPPSTEATQTRNFMKTGQLVIGGLGVVAASVSIFGLTYAALVSVGVFGLLGVLLHEVAGHLGIYSFLGGKGGKLMFGREGVWAQTDDLGFRKNAWVAIAGPLANIFFAAVAGLLLWAGVDSSALQAFAATNLVFGVTTLLPIGKGSDIENFFNFRQRARILDEYAAKPYPVILETGVQNYLWGQRGEDAYIPNLLGIPAGDSPYAEVWIGAHPDLPSTAILPKSTKIDMGRLVERAGEGIMSPHARDLYNGQLPFLFKVLAAGRPLSIQVHPNLEQAKAGFAKENQAGIDLKADNRNYKDPNHKPELIAAVTEFFGLRGFKPLDEIASAFKANVELMAIEGAQAFIESPSEENLKTLYGNIMALPQKKVDAILSPLIRRLNGQAAKAPFPKTSPEYWVLRSDAEFSTEGHHDRGVFSVYVLNLIRLNPGQAMYLSAGVPHAYLDGVGMEIMANSNNVLRGGLTPRHVDVPELMNTVVFQGEPPVVRDGVKVSETETVYREAGDVPEFQLSRITISRKNTHIQSTPHDVETLIVLEAENPLVLRMNDASQLTLTRGQTVLIPKGIGYSLLASEGTATLYRATVPSQTIAMGGMSYQDKEQKAAEIFGQLQTLQNDLDLRIIDNKELSRRVREIVSDLFNLQQDGNLGDVQDIADQVDNRLYKRGGKFESTKRIFAHSFNARYIRERQKNNDYDQGTLQSPYAIGGLDMNGKEAKKRDLLVQLSDPKNTNRFSRVAAELNRLDSRDGLEILESMVRSLRETAGGASLGIDLLKAVENEINGATIKTFNAGRLQQLQGELAEIVAPTGTKTVPESDKQDAPAAVVQAENPSSQFKQIRDAVTLDKLADSLNSDFEGFNHGEYQPKLDKDGQVHGPSDRQEALADLRERLNEDFSRMHTAVADSASLSVESQQYALSVQTLLMDALLIVSLMERGVQGADRIRLTTNPKNQLTAENRAPSFLDRTTLPAGVSDNENGIGAYNRGIETGKKMAADLTDSSGQAPRNLDAYVLYAMRHGLVPVPQGLRSITKANGGTISTFHHTVFGMRNVPRASAAASTGVGHYQANQLDVKQVTRGEAIQVLVAYNEDGSVRDVLYQRAKAGEYLTALPGYYDYMITTGNEPVEFDDISINLSQLGFSAEQIAKFNGGVQPANPPQKAPYVYVNGKLTPATGLSGQVPPIREIASVQAHQGASLFDIYGLLDESSLNLVAQSLVDRAGALVATTYRGRQPKPLAFGTSGLRGLVTEITDLEVYINTLGYLNYLQNQEQIKPGDTVVIARDFRDSSPRIAAAVAQAITDFGAQVVDLGRLSTPALTLWGIQNKVVSVMVTGSHIPFDRNGIKFNKASGEVVKSDEPGINQHVGMARESQYRKDPSDSLFDNEGNFKKTPVNRLNDVGADRAHDQAYVGKWTSASTNIPTDQRRQFSEGEEAYIQRYVSVYGSDALAGQYYSVYLHSGVGTRLFAEILRRLGANVYEFGPSDTFIAIDTEAISDETLDSISEMVKKIQMPWKATMTAVLSTDGDSDRPLVLGYNKVDGKTELDFVPGDIAGAFVAKHLGADAVAVPISANDVVDGYLEGVKILKTKIGSPYIVVGMESLSATNNGQRVVGWEANGGFLTGVEISHRQGVLAPLPTRDAVLPMVEILVSAKKENSSISNLFKPLRSRVGKADLIDNFPVEASAAIVREFSLAGIGVGRVVFSPDGKLKTWTVVDPAKGGNSLAHDNSPATDIRTRLQSYFTKDLGFGEIDWIDFTDGIRIHFTNNDIAHIRPSGNAPQLRIYSVADSAGRANEIVQNAIKEDGIYRRIQADLSSETAPQSVVGRYGPASILLSVKAKPFSVARVVVKMVLAWSAAAVAYVLGATGLMVGFPIIVAFIYSGLWVATGIILFSTSMDRMIAEGEGYSGKLTNENDFKAISELLTRLGFAPEMGGGKLTVKMGNRDVTVTIGYPQGGASWLAETTSDGAITVRPGIPGWLLPFVLRTEIYRVSLWEGAKTDLRLLPHLMRSSVTTRGPPVDTIEEDLPVRMEEVYPVIMSGGDSTRLFPVDKVLTPNLDASGKGRSLMRQMFERLTQDRENGEFLPFSRFFMLTASRIAETVKNQLPEVPSENLLSDPAKRNTFPAILWAVAHIKVKTNNPRATLTVFGADQVVGDTEEFRRVVKETARVAQNAKSVVAIGIKPSDNPVQWTNYGAIKAPNLAGVGRESRGMDRFVEKPNEEKAKEMLREGGHYWNAGWFTFTIEALEEAMSTNQPEMFAIYKEMLEFIGQNDYEGAKKAFEKFPTKIKQKGTETEVDNSMDYAIMEYLGQDTPVKGVVVPGGFPWIDAGNWGDVRQVLPADANGNVIRGNVVADGTKNSTLFAESGITIEAVGLEGIAVAVSATGNVIVTEEVKGGKVKPAVEPAKKEVAKDVNDPTRVNVVQKETAQVAVTNTGPGVVAVYGVKNLEIEVTQNRVVVRNTAYFPTRPARLSVSDEMVPEATAQRFGRERGVRVEPAQSPSALPSFIRYSGEGTVVPPTAREAEKFDSLTADVFLRANAYWTDRELAQFTQWATIPKNQATAQKIFLDVAFTLARLHGHNRTATGAYSVERQRNEMIALAVLADQMGMSDESRSNALDLYSREAAVQTIAARNNEDGRVADVKHQFMLAPVVRGEDGTVGWDPAAGQEGIDRWKKELRKVEEKTAVSLFLMSGDTSITPSELEEFLRAKNVESRGPMQGTFFVHQGNYLTADGRIDFGGIVGGLAPVHKTLASGAIAIVSMYENRFSFDNMPEGFSRENLLVYIINMLGKLTQAGTSIETDVNSLRLSFIAA